MKNNVKIAVDFDGVLVKTYKTIVKIVNEIKGSNFVPEDVKEWGTKKLFNLNDEEHEQLWKKLANSIGNLEPAEGLIFGGSSMFFLNSDKRVIVDVVTNSISKREDIIEKLKELFLIKNFEYNELIHTKDAHRDKTELDYDIYVDDSPLLAKKIAKIPNKTLILYDRPYNKNFDDTKCDNVVREKDWYEVTKTLFFTTKTKLGLPISSYFLSRFKN